MCNLSIKLNLESGVHVLFIVVARIMVLRTLIKIVYKGDQVARL